MPLWREAHVQVKSAKKTQVRSTFGRSDVVLQSRRAGFCTLCTFSQVRKMRVFCSSPCSVAVSTTTTTTLCSVAVSTTTTTTLYYTQFHSPPLRYILYTTPDYATLYSITPRYATLNYAPLHYIRLHYTTHSILQYIQLHYICNCNCNCNYNYTALHYSMAITLHYFPLHCLHYATLMTPLTATTLF